MSPIGAVSSAVAAQVPQVGQVTPNHDQESVHDYNRPEAVKPPTHAAPADQHSLNIMA